jgi:tetratricopeptide (TPR) repeat protein
MSWLEFHTQSEKFASQAESLCHQQDSMGAVEFYRLAAAAEKQALDNLDTNKTRTLGITVVSAASLYFKAKDFSQAKELANQWLQSNLLPSFAIKELQSLLLVIYLDELLKIPAAKTVKRITPALSDNVGHYYHHNPQREYGTGDLISFKITMKNDIDLPKHTRNSKVVNFHADIDMAIKNLLSGMKNQNLLSGSIALGQLVDIYRKLGNTAFVELWGDSKNVDRSPEILAAIQKASAKQENTGLS